jgi:CCR4-NOT transcription complex subunit 2
VDLSPQHRWIFREWPGLQSNNCRQDELLTFSVPREFPSLSGAPQQNQSQNSAQAVWTNAGQRATQQTPVQRQPPPPSSQPPSRTSQTQSHYAQQQASQDDLFPSGAQFANRLDDFRNNGQGQLGAGGQPQTGNIEEFPPLGRNTADLPPGGLPARMNDIGQERRTGFGSYGPGLAFSAQTQSAQARNILSATLNGPESSRVMSPGTASGAAGSGGALRRSVLRVC